MKMNAAVLYAPKEIKIEAIDIPQCGEGDVLVRLKKATLCPTDIKKFMGDKPDVIEGLKKEGAYILGHEAAGIIEKAGSLVTSVASGDRVAIQPMISCEACAYCKEGKSNMCLNLLGVGGSAGKFGDCIRLMKEQGIGGCFAEYIKVPERCVLKLPSEVDLAAGSLVEPLADVVHSVDAAGVCSEDTVVIIGLGPMGLFHVAAARYNHAKKIICIDVDSERLEIAKQLSADKVINSKEEDPVRIVKEETQGLGADKIFVTSGGRAQGICTEQAIQMAAKQGTISLFASAALTNDQLEVSMNQIHYNMLKLTGTVGFGRKDGEKAVEMLASGVFDYHLIRNVELPLERIEEAIYLYGKGANLKVGLDLEEREKRE